MIKTNSELLTSMICDILDYSEINENGFTASPS